MWSSLKNISIQFNPNLNTENYKNNSIPTATVQFKHPHPKEDSIRFINWLQIRLDVDSVVIGK